MTRWRRRPPARGAGRWRRVAVALVAVSPLALWTSGAAADPVGGAGSPAPVATQASDPTLKLVEATAVLEANDTFHLAVQVDRPPAGAVVQVTVFDRIDSPGATTSTRRATFKASLAGEKSGPAGRKLSPTGTPLPADGLVRFDLDSATETNKNLLRTSAGLFPVEVSLLSAKGSKQLAKIVTYFVRLPDPAKTPPLPVALVVPLAGDPSLQPDGSRAPLSPQTRRRLGGITDALVANPEVPATLQVSPELVTTLRGGAEEADVLAALQSALAGPQRELLAGPYVPLPVTGWLQVDLANELGAEYDRGSSALALLGKGDVSEDVLLGDATLTKPAADVLAIYRRNTKLVVPAAALDDPPSLPPAGVARLRDSSTEVLVVDPLLDQLDGSDGTGDPILDANHLLAALSLLALTNEGEGVAAVPLAPSIDPEMLGVVLAALGPGSAQAGANRLLTGVTAAGAFAAEPTSAAAPATASGTGTPAQAGGDDRPVVALPGLDAHGPPPPELRTLADRIHGGEPDIAEYQLMAPSDTVMLDKLREQLLVAGASTLTPDQQAAHLGAVGALIDSRIALIDPPDRQDIRLTARDGVIPLVLHNNTGFDLQLTVVLESDRLAFPEVQDNSLELVIPKEDQTFRYELRVRALTSGTTLLKLTVTSPTGHFTLGTTRLTVRSYAVSWVGKILLVGSGLFLALWWGTHIRRDRRQRRSTTGGPAVATIGHGPPAGEH